MSSLEDESTPHHAHDFLNLEPLRSFSQSEKDHEELEKQGSQSCSRIQLALDMIRDS